MAGVYVVTLHGDFDMSEKPRLEAAKGGSSVCVVAQNGGASSRLFDITRLNDIFRIFDDIETARVYALTA